MPANLDWKVADEKIAELTDKLLQSGSLGVSRYMEYILPLRNRLLCGERSLSLYDEIFSVGAKCLD